MDNQKIATFFTDASVSAQKLDAIVSSWREERKALRRAHSEQLKKFDENMIEFLWQCKQMNLATTTKLARLVGLSRQTLYEKWSEHGYNPTE